jgi:dTDP-glucose pyrophosphorylase
MDWKPRKKDNKMNQYKELCIAKRASISDALKQMDYIKKKLLIVINDNGTFHSLLSIGDVQRAIINNREIDTPVSLILRDQVRVAHINDNIEDIKNRMRVKRNDFMPVIDTENNIVKVVFWEDLFEDKKSVAQFDLPVVIMAGGRGTRLKPLTNIIPKPLIPINNKTIIEDIMDRFLAHGSNKFYISVNHKAEMIKYYFNSLNNTDYKIEYFQEDKPLGTAGSLHLLKYKINSTFFVSNCDIIIEQDYSEILNYHRENKNEITVVAALKSYPIPYGTLSTLKDGLLESIQEKPEFLFKINTGFYILEPHLIGEIPANKFYHITALMEKLNNEKRRVGVFPVTENSWTDFGNWEEYYNQIRKMNY